MKRTRQGDPHGQERKHCAVRHRSFLWRSPYKLGFLVAQAADSIFKSLGDADAVDAMERAIVGTIRVMAMQRKAEFKKGTDAFDMSSGFNPVRDEGVLKEILKGIFGKQ